MKNYGSLLEIPKGKKWREGFKVKKGAKTQRGKIIGKEILKITQDLSQNTIKRKNLDAFKEFKKYKENMFKLSYKVLIYSQYSLFRP